MVFCWANAGAVTANSPAAATANESAPNNLDLTSFSLKIADLFNRLAETLAQPIDTIQPLMLRLKAKFRRGHAQIPFSIVYRSMLRVHRSRARNLVAGAFISPVACNDCPVASP